MTPQLRQQQRRILTATGIALFLVDGVFVGFLHRNNELTRTGMIENKIAGDAATILPHLYQSGNYAWLTGTLRQYEAFQLPCLSVQSMQGSRVYGTQARCKKSIVARNYVGQPVLLISYDLPEVGLASTFFENWRGLFILFSTQFMFLCLAYRILSELFKSHAKALVQAEQARAETQRQLTLSRERLEKQAALAALATQVAHDIRSPVTTLSYAIQQCALPEDKRELVRSAIDRIQDITDSLWDVPSRPVETRRAGDIPPEAQPIEPETDAYPLASLLERVVSEHRHGSRSGAGIILDLKQADDGIFCRVQPADFKRVVSNLLSNGTEALEDGGAVRVSLERREGRVAVSVSDDGKGIPAEVLARLGERGVTYGKADGHGLGLWHARSCAERWGGSLDIQSKLGEGTAVSLLLPEAAPPRWHTPKLAVDPTRPVVVVDDDTGIHGIWEDRFAALIDHPWLVHLKTPDGLRRWASEYSDLRSVSLFLIDHDFHGAPDNGLALIEELGLQRQAVLVTGRSEDRRVLAECRRLGVRLVPKNLAASVPITVEAQTESAVLIDDDQLVRRVWADAASARGKSLVAFSSGEEFLAAAATIGRNTPIYVDYQIEGGRDGGELTRELHGKGFTNLYLCTGRRPASLPPMPWLKKVVGKDAPW